MTTDWALDLLRSLLIVLAQVAGPALFAALVVGVAVGIMQTATQVNEASVSFVTKLVGVGVALLVGGPSVLSTLVDYTVRSISSIAEVVR